MNAKSIPVVIIEPGHFVEVKVDETWVWKELESKTVRTLVNNVYELKFTDGSLFTVHGNDFFLVSEDPTGIPNRQVVPDWEEYFLEIAKTVALRAKCRRRQVGALIVDSQNRIVSTGYNGFPKNSKGDCLTGSCPRGLTRFGEILPDSSYTDPGKPSFCPAIHAEANALLYVESDRARGSVMYVTDKPCPDCTRLIAGAGISKLVWPNGTFNPMDSYGS